MQTFVRETYPAVPLRLRSKALLNDDAYFEFCQENPDVRFERTPKGEIIVVPPAGLESDHRSLDIGTQLRVWSKRTKTGHAFGSSAEFILPTKAAYSPDAAWVSNQRLRQLTPTQKRTFPPVVPEFVIEAMSPSDRLRAAQAKMQDWIAGGVDLAWLIDGDHQTVYVYRKGQSKAEKKTGIKKLAGDGPVAGFVLNLTDIWRGL